MKLTEITVKDKFVGNLKDPVAQEAQSSADHLNKTAGRGYSFNAYSADKELCTIIGRPPGFEEELEEFNMIDHIRAVINKSQHWNYKTWNGDVEEEFAVYMVRREA